MQNQVILTPESSHGWNLRYGLSLAQVRKRFLRSLQDSLDGPTGNAGLLGEGLRDLLGPRLRTPRGSLRGPEVPPPVGSSGLLSAGKNPVRTGLLGLGSRIKRLQVFPCGDRVPGNW